MNALFIAACCFLAGSGIAVIAGIGVWLGVTT